ncbi:hypothetical protein Dimus_035918 [Dionaea muscipula]
MLPDPSVRGVKIEFDHMKLASILGIPCNNGICEYIEENVVPRLGKRDTTSYMDLIYMDHLIARRLDHELPYEDWLTMVFEDFGVPLVDKKGEKSKRYDYFEGTFLTMCKLTRENREAVIDEAAVQGESGSDDQFFDAQVDVEEPVTEAPAAPAFQLYQGIQQLSQKKWRQQESIP